MGFSGDSAGGESPAMWETWIRSVHWEDPLEKGKAMHSSFMYCIVHRVTKSQMIIKRYRLKLTH